MRTFFCNRNHQGRFACYLAAASVLLMSMVGCLDVSKGNGSGGLGSKSGDNEVENSRENQGNQGKGSGSLDCPDIDGVWQSMSQNGQQIPINERVKFDLRIELAPDGVPQFVGRDLNSSSVSVVRLDGVDQTINRNDGPKVVISGSCKQSVMMLHTKQPYVRYETTSRINATTLKLTAETPDKPKEEAIFKKVE